MSFRKSTLSKTLQAFLALLVMGGLSLPSSKSFAELLPGEETHLLLGAEIIIKGTENSASTIFSVVTPENHKDGQDQHFQNGLNDSIHELQIPDGESLLLHNNTPNNISFDLGAVLEEKEDPYAAEQPDDYIKTLNFLNFPPHAYPELDNCDDSRAARGENPEGDCELKKTGDDGRVKGVLFGLDSVFYPINTNWGLVINGKGLSVQIKYSEDQEAIPLPYINKLMLHGTGALKITYEKKKALFTPPAGGYASPDDITEIPAGGHFAINLPCQSGNIGAQINNPNECRGNAKQNIILEGIDGSTQTIELDGSASKLLAICSPTKHFTDHVTRATLKSPFPDTIVIQNELMGEIDGEHLKLLYGVPGANEPDIRYPGLKSITFNVPDLDLFLEDSEGDQKKVELTNQGQAYLHRPCIDIVLRKTENGLDKAAPPSQDDENGGILTAYPVFPEPDNNSDLDNSRNPKGSGTNNPELSFGGTRCSLQKGAGSIPHHWGLSIILGLLTAGLTVTRLKGAKQK